MLAGLLSIIAAIVGGILSSLGNDIYDSLKGQILQSSAVALVIFLQILFLMMGILGIGLVLFDYYESRQDSVKNRNARSKRKVRR
jgi:hypothetical protein